MPGSIGLPEMLIVLVLALIVLGPKRLPSAGRSLGSGLRQFKDGLGGAVDEMGTELDRPTSERAVPADATDAPDREVASSS
jgi:sec-independent protein translocase protein TatA